MKKMKRRDVKCVVGVVTAVWNASRIDNAKALCERLTNGGSVQTARRRNAYEEEGGDEDVDVDKDKNIWKSREYAVYVRDKDKDTTTMNDETEVDDEEGNDNAALDYTVDECVVFAGVDGRQIDGDFLMALARAGDEIAPVLRENKLRQPGKVTTNDSSSRHGFEGPGSVANAMSHSDLAEYFLNREDPTTTTTATDRPSDCFIMFEDDAAPVPEFDAKLGTLLAALDEEGRGTWDVINLNGASRLVLMNVACLVVRNVDAFYAYGSFTRSVGLAFSKRGLERFLDARPIDTHIDLFLEKLVRSNDLYGIRTCEPLVSNFVVGENESEDDDVDASDGDSERIGDFRGKAGDRLPSAKQIVNDHERLTNEMWHIAEEIYRNITAKSSASVPILSASPSEEAIEVV